MIEINNNAVPVQETGIDEQTREPDFEAPDYETETAEEIPGNQVAVDVDAHEADEFDYEDEIQHSDEDE